MTEWPPRLDQGRDEVCVASGFPVFSEGWPGLAPWVQPPAWARSRCPLSQHLPLGQGLREVPRMEAQNLVGITPRTGTSHGACSRFSPLLPRGPRWMEWSKAPWPVLLCPQSHPQRRVRPAAFTSGPAHWTPGPCPRCPLESEPRLACGQTFLGPTIAGHFAARPGSPGVGQLLAVGRRGGCPAWVSSCAPGAERGGSCMWSPCPASSAGPCSSGSSPHGGPQLTSSRDPPLGRPRSLSCSPGLRAASDQGPSEPVPSMELWSRF